VVSFLQVSDLLIFIIVEKLPASIVGQWPLVQAAKDYYDGLKRRCLYLGVRKNWTITFDVSFSRDMMQCSLINDTNV
jgi:hypothetical protein